MALNENEIEKIRKISDADHTCPTCHQRVAIDTYGISTTMVGILRKMAKQTADQLKSHDEKGRSIDTYDINLVKSEPNQLSKMRFLGLVAKVRNDQGTHIPRNWLITKRGWAFLDGAEVPAKVEVYDNAVLGNVGGTTNIYECEGMQTNATDVIDQKNITTEQSKMYVSAKGYGDRNVKMQAKFKGKTFGENLINGEIYDLEIMRLQVGKPVRIVKPFIMEFDNIAKFGKAWERV